MNNQKDLALPKDMTLEEFYFSIKEKEETNEFNLVKNYMDTHVKVDGPVDFCISGETLFYLRLFVKHHDKKWFLSKNWSAFLMNVGWFVYRRVYFIAFVLILLLFFIPLGISISLFSSNEEFLLKAVELKKISQHLLFLVLFAPFSLLGNCLYLQTVKRRFQKKKTTPASMCSWILFWGLSMAFWASDSLGYTNYFKQKIRLFYSNDTYTYFSNGKIASLSLFNKDGTKKEEKFFRLNGSLEKQVFYLSPLFEAGSALMASKFGVELKGKKEYGVSKIQEIFYGTNNKAEKMIGYHYDGHTRLYELTFSESGEQKHQTFFYESGKVLGESFFGAKGELISLKKYQPDGKTAISFTTFRNNLPEKEAQYYGDGRSKKIVTQCKDGCSFEESLFTEKGILTVRVISRKDGTIEKSCHYDEKGLLIYVLTFNGKEEVVLKTIGADT